MVSLNFQKLVPEGTFIRDYMDYMKGVETPSSFDFYTALWILGASLDNDIYVRRPRFPVMFSHFTVLVSSSGQSRRGYNISCAYDALKEQGRTYKVRPPSDAWLTGGTNVTAEECNIILGKDIHSKGLLNRLSGQYNKETSFLSSSTPTKLFDECHPLLMEPDFASKCTFVYDDARKGVRYWPKEEDNGRPRRSLQITVQRSREYGHPIDINDGGLKAFGRWYRRRTVTQDPQRSGLTSRDDDHILRTAGLLAINDGTLQIQNRHIESSRKLETVTTYSREVLFGGLDLGGKGRIIEGIDRVRRGLIESGGDGVRSTILYKKTGPTITYEEFKLLMRIMHEAGLVTVTRVGEGKRGRPYVFYRTTEKLKKDLVVSEVLSLMAAD